MIFTECLIIGLLVSPPPPTKSIAYWDLLQIPTESVNFDLFTKIVSYPTQPIEGTAFGAIYAGGAKSVVLESPEQARSRALEKLSNKLLSFRYDLLGPEFNLNIEQIDPVIDISTTLITQLPAAISLPNAVILTNGVSLYWDFDKIYAEIAIEADGSVSVYAKHPGRPEVLVDSNIQEIKERGLFFLPDIREMLT